MTIHKRPTRNARPVHAEATRLGYKLVRAKNHRIYQLPNGVKVTVASSPSQSAVRNEIARLRQFARKAA